MLDEYGRERRPLPPLALDGQIATTDPPAAEPTTRLVKTVKRRAAIKEEVKVEEPVKVTKAKKVAVTALEAAVRKDLETYPDAILLTQVGSFFESYFDQARTVASVLGIKLTSKLFGKGSNRVREPFCGFPLSHLLKHVSTLVEAGHKVVIVEEFKEAGSANSGVTRRVSRVVTPGTGVDESFVEMEKMNFVLALGAIEGGKNKEIGMAYRDISTGASFTRVSTLASLRDDIQLVRPKEVVVDERLESLSHGAKVLAILEGEQQRESLMVSAISTNAIPSSSSGIVSAQSAAEDVLLAYLAGTLVDLPPPRTRSTFVDPASVMHLDAVTLKSLEIRESLRGGTKGSLLHSVKRTVTPGGTRLLTERLTSPSTDLAEINTRLTLVSAFHDNLPASRSYLRALLRTLDDTPRLLQRLYLRRGSAFDLLGLKKTMRALQTIRDEIEARVPPVGASKRLLKQFGIDQEAVQAVRHLIARLGDFDQLATEIETAIDEEALLARSREEERKAMIAEEYGERAREREEEEETITRAEGDGLWGQDQPWVVKDEFSPAIKQLHKELTTLRDRAFKLQAELRDRYSSKNLTLKVLPKIGAAAHVLSRDGVLKLESDESAHLYQKSNSTRAYVIREWVLLWKKMEAVSAQIQEYEKETMAILTTRVLDNYDNLLSTADALAELDVIMGFAELGQERQWVKPIVDKSKALEIVKGRHPTVESALLLQNREFTPNCVAFHHPDDGAEDPSFIHVLTGPNMAGKSTFLRQTALITILAQAGSFVPAQSARIGIFDKVFSRVGARDELDRDRSTFMIEMDEATTILEGATSRSLVLLDELGRGTSPIDGLAIAYGALEHLAHVNRCRTLFATHYHRLGDLLGYDESDSKGRGEWTGVEFWCTDVEEDAESVRYVHEIRRGLNNDSAGLVIARLAGMPSRAIRTAQDLRDKFLAGLV
ncbi:mismatch repair ATPase MSH1 [Sporobolomyces koalae]|uniref:mismatch repair ATPase MSH1 n=1 Tax=Sporobolomyces koalae TaxID=500713 RepID=UPI00317439C6